MNTKASEKETRISRRQPLGLPALLGALVAGALTVAAAGNKYSAGNPNAPLEDFYPTHYDTQRYTYFEQLPKFNPKTPLEANEMRITFMGSTFPMTHRSQKEMSLFVEVGWDPKRNVPRDQFIFDIGSGASANYIAMGIDFARMNKIFLNHLHGDHVTDLVHVYSFGDAGTRKSPLYVWGNGNSGVTNPGNGPVIINPTNPIQTYATSPKYYDDGIYSLCAYLREALRWQTESQAFQYSGYETYPMPEQIQKLWNLPVLPEPVGDDPPQDANALVPITLDWTKYGAGLRTDGSGLPDNLAYDNKDTGAKITHFPVIHCRKGSIGYKVEWTYRDGAPPLTMIYTSDTKPETNSIYQACNYTADGKPQGVDLFIHEVILAPEPLTVKSLQMDAPPPGDPQWWQDAVNQAKQVEDSSHTPQGAFGYILSQISPRPRLTVATHFPTADDTVACALRSIQAHCQDIKKVGDQLVFSFDLMVLRVFPDKILQRRAVVNDFEFSTLPSVQYTNMFAPKYHTDTGAWDPVVQLDQSTAIPPTNSDGTINYRPDGW